MCYYIYIVMIVYGDYMKSNLVSNICSMDNDEYKDSIIKNYEKYGFDEFSAFEIVKSMSIDSIKKIIENHTLYSFTDRDLVKIVNLIDDVSYKEKIISNYKHYCFDLEDVACVIVSFPDEYKKEFISNNKYKFDSYCKSIIVDSINDEEYKYNIITKYKDYDLCYSDVSYIVSGFRNKDKYIFDLLSNYKEYGFDSYFIASIVFLMSDKNKEKIVFDNKYDFSPLLLCDTISSVSDESKRISIFNKLYSKGVFGDIKLTSSICLPPEMTIGIEIESEGKNSRSINTLMLPSGWDIHLETTLNKGTEVVSPVLHSGDDKEISKVCNLLSSLGQYVSSNCAGHIHIGANYFGDDVECFKVLLEMFSNLEKIMFLISNSAGDIPREKAFKYAIPITPKIVNKSINFDSINDVNSFSLNIHNVQDMYSKPRYSSINFENLSIPLQNTIEFRIPNGTLDPNVWITNINLFGGLMVAAKNISMALKKSFENTTDDDKKNLYFYEKIKDVNISDLDRLKCLLNILPSSMNKDVYLERYEVNTTLVEKLRTGEILDTISVFRPIRITTCSDELKEKVIDGYKDYIKSNVSIR